MGVFEELGIEPLINASGYVTRYGAAPMLPEVVAVMAEAARSSVSIAELEQAAGQVIAEATGAESGYVTSGSAAALALAAAACLAGADRDRINRLPDVAGQPDTIVIPGPHRDSYDRCFRVAGARVATAGTPERCIPADLAAAIDGRTVAVGWFSDYEAALPLPPVVALARERGIPVIVDAAIALPPPENLRRFVAEGADLVAYSAGKDLRGPQAAGFLAGRADLIASVALQHQDMAAYTGTWDSHAPLLSPGHGLGRPMKVGKEEIVGALEALRRYPARDHASELAEQEAGARWLASELGGLPGVAAAVGHHQTPGWYARLTIDPAFAGLTAEGLAARLLVGRPRIAAYARGDALRIGTAALRPGEVEIVAARVANALRRH